MAAEVEASEYARFLAEEYLSSFIAEGGAAVKFAVGPDSGSLTVFDRVLAAESERRGFTFVRVGSGLVKISMIQHIFFAVAAQIDWQALACRMNVSLASGLYENDGGPTTYAHLAELNGVDQSIVMRDMKQRLTERVIKNYWLAKDFRVAMAHLCLAELEGDVVGREYSASVLEWLRGELRLMSAMRPMQIYQRIGRHNARAMLVSTARWIRQTGGDGLVVNIDLGALVTARRQDAAEGSLYYTPAALWDAYEVLRQFIDATDEMEGILIVVSAPDTLLDEFSRRSLQQYRALRNRIWDDVRDRRRANPYAPMVRLAARQGGVA